MTSSGLWNSGLGDSVRRVRHYDFLDDALQPGDEFAAKLTTVARDVLFDQQRKRAHVGFERFGCKWGAGARGDETFGEHREGTGDRGHDRIAERGGVAFEVVGLAPDIVEEFDV